MRSQFSSVTVIPLLIPKIWVCTAPATAVLQTSELLTTTLGEFAVGTDLSVTTVEDTVFVSAANKGLVHIQIITKVVKISNVCNQYFTHCFLPILKLILLFHLLF